MVRLRDHTGKAMAWFRIHVVIYLLLQTYDRANAWQLMLGSILEGSHPIFANSTQSKPASLAPRLASTLTDTCAYVKRLHIVSVSPAVASRLPVRPTQILTIG
jgi:hypothetical protein